MEISSTPNSIRSQLIQLNNDLSKFDMADLSPEVVGMIDELVRFCTSNKICSSSLDQMLETDSELRISCENLCRLFAHHGFYFELHSAKVCAANKKENLNEHFKHRRAYEELIQCELNMLQGFGVHLATSSTSEDNTDLLVRKIAFIGSGPIPTTSMIILNNHGPLVDIYNFDLSQEANQYASIITEQVLPAHLSKRMHFITQDISEDPLPEKIKLILNQCQLIYVAAYVGVNELEKLNILRNIVHPSNGEFNNKTKQYFIIRTAEGLCRLLFPRVRSEKIAMLKETTIDDSDGKYLFQIKTVHQSLDSYGLVTIIAANL